MLLNYSRSVDELQSIGFKYDEKSSKLKCVLCDLSKETTDTLKSKGIFSFSNMKQSSFSVHENLSRSFTNLKGAVKKHIISSKAHCVNLEKEEERK